MNTMSPFVIYAMVATIVAAGLLTVWLLDWYDSKHNPTMQE